MKTRTVLVLSSVTLLYLTGCATMRRPKLELPEDPASLTIIQREAKEIPGSRGTLLVSIGDITGGQVILSIYGPGLKPIVDYTSVSPGDIVPFTVHDQQYYLLVKELRNFIIGDDIAVFEISTIRPLVQDPSSVQRT